MYSFLSMTLERVTDFTLRSFESFFLNSDIRLLICSTRNWNTSLQFSSSFTSTSFFSKEFRSAMKLLGIKLEYIQKHTPEDNGDIESFHNSIKTELIRTMRTEEIPGLFYLYGNFMKVSQFIRPDIVSLD